MTKKENTKATKLQSEYASVEEWKNTAKKLYKSMADMRFRCPNCGHVQSLQDFINLGMTQEEAANRVYFSCIGRFNKDQSHNGTLGDGKSPCDYTCGGLIKLGDIIHDGKEDIYTFPFAD